MEESLPPREPLLLPNTRNDTNVNNVPWFDQDIPVVPEPMRQLLEEYSGVEPEQVKSHILNIRQRAWKIWPYPCIGMFRFLDLSLSLSPAYPEILSRLLRSQQQEQQQKQSTTPRLLDLGSCFGQDVRKLIFDGAPVERVCGLELRRKFIDLGFELFRDADRNSRPDFIAADVFDRNHPVLAQLEGSVDIIHAASFIHLFDYEGQIAVCKRLVQLLRPPAGHDDDDVMIVGRQVGHLHPGEFPHNAPAAAEGGATTTTMFRHDERSFAQMWSRVGAETGTAWTVEVQLRELASAAARSTSGVPDDAHARALTFVVRRARDHS